MTENECAVIGGGFAGCSAAIELANSGKKVDIYLKGRLYDDSNSLLTAGGFAAVSSSEEIADYKDSFDLHIQDTLNAGKGLNNVDIVKYCVEHFYPDVIEWLENLGVAFDTHGQRISLHKEGGHSKSRVFHYADVTGQGIMKVLISIIKTHENITIHENHTLIDFITQNRISGNTGHDSILGFYVYDEQNNYVEAISSKGVFLATGGLGKVFMFTSNPDMATGDGYAACWRAGLNLVNMEFVQFHPSVYYDPTATNEFGRRFLFTEALRGAGAFLKLSKDSKEDFVLKYDPLGSKSTRDVVTKAEDEEMRKHGLDCVWLDCTSIPEEVLKNEFRNSYEFCLSKGINMAKEPIPVVYAEHYSNGGVQSGPHGETDISGLYVIGETAYTGLHGATRLASNSGPECILFGRLAAQHFSRLDSSALPDVTIPEWDHGKATHVKDKVAIKYYWDVVRRTMTQLCGISRNTERLTAAKEVMDALNAHIKKFYWNYYITRDFLEVRNIATVASIIIESALQRKESRACHFMEDFPVEKEEFKKLSVIRRKQNPNPAGAVEDKTKKNG